MGIQRRAVLPRRRRRAPRTPSRCGDPSMGSRRLANGCRHQQSSFISYRDNVATCGFLRGLERRPNRAHRSGIHRYRCLAQQPRATPRRSTMTILQHRSDQHRVTRLNPSPHRTQIRPQHSTRPILLHIKRNKRQLRKTLRTANTPAPSTFQDISNTLFNSTPTTKEEILRECAHEHRTSRRTKAPEWHSPVITGCHRHLCDSHHRERGFAVHLQATLHDVVSTEGATSIASGQDFTLSPGSGAMQPAEPPASAAGTGFRTKISPVADSYQRRGIHALRLYPGLRRGEPAPNASHRPLS